LKDYKAELKTKYTAEQNVWRKKEIYGNLEQYLIFEEIYVVVQETLSIDVEVSPLSHSSNGVWLKV